MWWLTGLLWRRLGWDDITTAPGGGGAGFGVTPFGTGQFGQ